MFNLFLLEKMATAQVQCDASGGCDTGLPQVQSTDFTTIFQYLFGFIGALSVLILVVAGLRFILANGDPQSVAKARNTIIYAAIGLAIAVSAEIIVTFVLNNV